MQVTRSEVTLAKRQKADAEEEPGKPDPRPERSRAKIIAAARKLFLDKGYDINLDEIAAEAGLVKRTLYNLFSNKRTLLQAVLDTEHASFRAQVPEYAGVDLRGILAHHADLQLRFSLTPDALKFYRLIMGDVSQFPDMAAAVYETGVGGVIASLSSKLEQGMDAGVIKRIDARRMAERFYAAVSGMSHRRAAAGMGFDPPEYVERYVQETVDLFVQALTPDQESAS